jgi:hypothetical protein
VDCGGERVNAGHFTQNFWRRAVSRYIWLGQKFRMWIDPLAPAMTRNRFKSRMQLLKIMLAMIVAGDLRG